MIEIIAGLLIPFLGTAGGAGCVFFMRSGLNERVQRCLLGFAAGVMTAASVWSLLIPAIEQSAGLGGFACFPAVVAIMLYITPISLLLCGLSLLGGSVGYARRNWSYEGFPGCRRLKAVPRWFLFQLHGALKDQLLGVA